MPVRRSNLSDDPSRHSSTKGEKASHLPLKIINERFQETQDDPRIEWSNLIFLPFHPVFRLFVLYAVTVKAILGPIQTVFPIVYCNDVMDYNPFLIFVKYSYWYFCDSLYGIDTFLHIVHRQVTDKAMRREYVPKSALLLLCDLLSLIPFFRLVETNPCPPARVWPNILAFTEFLVIYRVTQYFSLVSTHCMYKLIIGYTLVLSMCLNCITCFMLTLTYQGFCDRCTQKGIYFDWRASVVDKLNETDEGYATYVYAFSYIFSFCEFSFFEDEIKPMSIYEFLIACIFMTSCYILNHFVVAPKSLAESMLRLRSVCLKHPVVKKVIEETKWRNCSPNAYKDVENYYKIVWRKMNGIIETPESFEIYIPRYLRLEITQDLLWPLFHHSPILRKTSHFLRRCMAENIKMTYRFPGDRFFSDPDSNSNVYYLKSGVVQLISNDDGVTPILSVTSGTVFGDIHYIVPHMMRKAASRCLTYCELFCLHRRTIIKALQRYPQDKRVVLAEVKNRIDHAKTLFANKKLIRGLDRNEDEGIAWIKRRWWQIFGMVDIMIKRTGKSREQIKLDLSREEAIYHCSKHIGQIVLCTQTELQTKSMFANTSFPWILYPQSKFGLVWERIVLVTVALVLMLFPQNLIKSEIPMWFILFVFYSDTIYVLDIGVSLFTAVRKENYVVTTFTSVLLERFKSLIFMLDILATLWIEDLVVIAGASEYYYTVQFNRLLKVHKLFKNDNIKQDIRKDPTIIVCYIILLTHFSFTVISSHVVFEMSTYIDKVTTSYFFGEQLCSKTVHSNCTQFSPVLGVTVLWAFEWAYTETSPDHLIDIYVGLTVAYLSYLIIVFCKGRFVAYLYLQNRDATNYQIFVSRLKKYYEYYRIHQELLNRVDRYLICHWKYYKGRDVLYPNNLQEEPYEVYWKAQGEVAEKIIRDSKAFDFADTRLIKELARSAKFLLLPKMASICLFGVHVKNVTWIVQGFAKSEYHDENGELLSAFHGRGSILALSSIYMQKPSLRTYSAYTDCEILYIAVTDFFQIYKRYTTEYTYLENCAKEFTEIFDEMFVKYVLKHRDYRHKLRDRIYSTRMSMISTSKVIADIQDNRSLPYEGVFWGEPESKFMQSWFILRVVTVYISIMAAALLGGVGASSRWIFMMISVLCDSVAFIDIILKLFLAYYDKRGILITNKKHCFLNYVTKGFLLDVIGAFPWFEVVRLILTEGINDDTGFLINTVCKFAHIYILFAYFEYICDIPSSNVVYFMILKWQLVNILIALGASHYLMVQCVHFTFDDQMYLVDVTLRNTCWMPTFHPLPEHLTLDHLHLIFVQSLNLAESGMLGMNFGRFTMNRTHLGVGILLFLLSLVFWFITCYTLTLLVLSSRGDSLYKHSVEQLQKFLKAERVEKDIIAKVEQHFQYCWERTKGINIQQLQDERIGAVFRHDLNYYFYKKTFTIFDSILKCGETIQRQLAGVSVEEFYLPGYDIFREMDLVATVFIVHRGRVNVFKNGKRLIILTKGDIFGQLTGTKLRPINVTATASSYADLLAIDVPVFQSIITDAVRRTIARSPQHRKHFMATKNIFIENPYDSVKYLLRGRKTIRFPWSEHYTEMSYGNWYANYLILMWLIGPYLTSLIVITLIILPYESMLWVRLYCVLLFLDILHLINFISEFYTLQTAIVDNKCTYVRVGLDKFKYWGLYVDIVSFLIPLATIFTHDWRYQLARLLRLKWFLDFEFHFCRSFQNKWTPAGLKFAFVTLLIHLLTCGWEYFGCRDEVFPIPIVDMRYMNQTVDFTQWAHPNQRKGGCARTTRDIYNEETDTSKPSFVVPVAWTHDYTVALTLILLIQTTTNIDCIIPISLIQVYYKVFITYIMYLLHVYLLALGLNRAYTTYREMYQYDYEVRCMMTYFRNWGLCKSLSDKVMEYTAQLWMRHKGDKLPSIAYEAPSCLRQDLFSSLYMHHLDATATFRDLPYYFKRQLAARLRRVVIFPGKCIIREGDTFSITYFIHEGEVEKWYSDTNGESRLLSVLYTNGYFGCISGLFVNVGFQFSYYTRTVVDMVFLRLNNWQDLLDGYPDIKATLYESTKSLKANLAKNAYNKV